LPHAGEDPISPEDRHPLQATVVNDRCFPAGRGLVVAGRHGSCPLFVALFQVAHSAAVLPLLSRQKAHLGKDPAQTAIRTGDFQTLSHPPDLSHCQVPAALLWMAALTGTCAVPLLDKFFFAPADCPQQQQELLGRNGVRTPTFATAIGSYSHLQSIQLQRRERNTAGCGAGEPIRPVKPNPLQFATLNVTCERGDQSQ
jgi:hypothetical protein